MSHITFVSFIRVRERMKQRKRLSFSEPCSVFVNHMSDEAAGPRTPNRNIHGTHVCTKGGACFESHAGSAILHIRALDLRPRDS